MLPILFAPAIGSALMTGVGAGLTFVAANAVVKAAKPVGSAIEWAADGIWDGVEYVAQGVWDGAKDVSSFIERQFDDDKTAPAIEAPKLKVDLDELAAYLKANNLAIVQLPTTEAPAAPEGRATVIT